MHRARRFLAVPLAVVLALAIVAAAALPGTAAAEPHQKIRRSLVYLKATGITGGSGAMAGQAVEAEATGFLVSDDGLILTAYHLLEGLGADVDGQTVTISANIGSKSSRPEFDDATIMNAAPLLDLLLLKIDPRLDPFVPVEIGSAVDLTTDDVIYTSGFRKSASYHTALGHLSSRSGPRGHLWTVDTRFEDGQSGSPVYDADSRVIGIAKGSDKDADDQNYMVPIQFADPLLAHLRLFKIQKEIGEISDLLKVNDPRVLKSKIDSLSANIDAVRKHFTWSGRFAADGRLLVDYSKLIAGEPQVQRISYSVDVPLPDHRYTFEQQDQTRTLGGGAEDADGEFELTGVGPRIASFRAGYNVKSIGRVRVRLRPTLSDGTVLPVRDVFVDDTGATP